MYIIHFDIVLQRGQVSKKGKKKKKTKTEVQIDSRDWVSAIAQPQKSQQKSKKAPG